MRGVSVIVPVYNSERTIRRCLDSICNQSLLEIEIIIVDDGSKDNSLEICEKYKEKDSRIQLISQENLGVSSARNRGMDNAKFDYIGFVDSDDWIHEDMFRVLLEYAIKFESDIVSSNFIIDTPFKSINNTNTFKSGYYGKQDLIKAVYPELIANNVLSRPIPTTLVTKIFKRSFIKGNMIRFSEKLKSSEDSTFVLECILDANSLFHDNDLYFYHYVTNPDSVTNVFLKDSWNNYRNRNNYIRKLIEHRNLKDSSDFENQLELDIIIGALMTLNYLGKSNSTYSIIDAYNSINNICEDLKPIKSFGNINYKQISYKKRITVRCINKRRTVILTFLYLLNRINNAFRTKFQKIAMR